jgi:hypothetical protein
MSSLLVIFLIDTDRIHPINSRHIFSQRPQPSERKVEVDAYGKQASIKLDTDRIGLVSPAI